MNYFENKNYKVVTTEDNLGYNVVNKITGNVEAMESLLPNALYLAENLDKAVEDFAADQAAKNRKVVTPSDEIIRLN